jgi:hypothetical protein
MSTARRVASTVRSLLLASSRAALAGSSGFAIGRARRVAAAGVVAGAVVLLGASVASAATTRELVGTFGGAGSTTSDPAPLSNPQNVAVNQSTGDVYVADTGNNRVEEFDASGNFIAVFGQDVDQTTGANVCTATSGDTCQAGTPGSAPDEFTTAEFVAVDNDPSSVSHGDVYVGDTGDNLVQKFDANGNLITSWGDGGGSSCGTPNGQLSGACATGGPFAPIAGITVDASGNLLVLENGCDTPLFAFSEDGTAQTPASPTPRCHAASGLAANATGDVFKVNGDGSVEEMTSSASDVGTVTPDTSLSPPVAGAIAVEPASGDLYVANAAGSIDHYAFNSSGQVVEPSGTACTPSESVGCPFATDSTSIGFAGSGIAVASASGDTYVSNPATGQVYVYGPLVAVPDVSTGTATGVGPSSATLNGTVNPDGTTVTDCHFEYIADTAYDPSASDPYAGGGTAACASTPSGSSPMPVSASVSGLQEGVAYDFRLDASNTNGQNSGQNEQFTTATPPTVDAAAATNVGATSAELTAKINPDNGDTSCQFEYGTTTSYGTTVPCSPVDLGSGSSDVPATAQITGLAQPSEYHWRVVASNGAGTITSPDHTFVYTVAAGLPDGRAYELVTPPQKNGALVGNVFLGLRPDIAADGSHLLAMSIQCFANAQACNSVRYLEGSPYEFTRDSDGWHATPLSRPATEVNQSTPLNYNADSGVAVFTMPTPPNGEDDYYVRETSGSFVDMGPVTPPANGAHGPPPLATDLSLGTSDFSHYIFVSYPEWSFDSTVAASVSLYEYVGTGNSQPLLVGVSGGPGSTSLVSECGTFPGGSENTQQPGELSADGQTVFFTALSALSGSPGPGCPPADELFARIDQSSTVPISESPQDNCTGACASSPPGDAFFQAASADGSLAYFTSTQQLTNDASEDSTSGDSAYDFGCGETTGPNGCNLYVYDLSKPAGQNLVDVSAGDTSGQGPQVQGVMAVSPDGSRAYFVAKGVLTKTANTQGAIAQPGEDNLYLWERDPAHPSGTTTFIATLPASDATDWTLGSDTSANVTPDGRFLVFTSGGRLTPDDSAPIGVAQVFRYDAQTGELTRVSIGNEGFNDNGNSPDNDACEFGASCPDGATIVPPAEYYSLQQDPARLDPTMSDNGSRVFFESALALAPGALNDVQIATDGSGNPVYAQNVYEWEQPGVGSCSSDQPSGCVYLISGGHDVGARNGISDVFLLGADTSGANVFFTTADQLVPQDTDSGFDFYDARIGGGFASILPAPDCQGDACQGQPAAPPNLPSGGTISYLAPAGGKATPAAKLAVRTRDVRGPVFVLTVRVSGAGRIAIAGGGIKTVRKQLRAGTWRLRVVLTAGERQRLKRQRRVTLRLHLRFKPASGPALTAIASLTVRTRP